MLDLASFKRIALYWRVIEGAVVLKLVNYEKDGLVKAGIVQNEMIYGIVQDEDDIPIASVDQILDESLLESIRARVHKITAGTQGIPLRSAKLRSPILYPEKIIMVGVNYGAHGKEENIKPPPFPYLFTKYRNALIGPNEPIIVPSSSKQVDWEVELAVVIGREGKNIGVNNAYDYVAGYAVSNDVSFRDFQMQRFEPLGMNWIKGKSLDASFPFGPWVVTRDEIPNPHDLDISLSVNGVQKQSSNTSDMIFKIDALVSYASIGMTLRPGDIISTGTPSGVGHSTGGPYLKDGDLVEAKVERIGTLTNPVRAEV